MSTSRVESLPATWDDTRDLPFFRITARLFPPNFCFGAGVLLASYDDVQDGHRTTAPARTAQPMRELVPVPVRRSC